MQPEHRSRHVRKPVRITFRTPPRPRQDAGACVSCLEVFSLFKRFLFETAEKYAIVLVTEDEMRRRCRKQESGQVLAEYALMLGLTVMLTLALFLLMRVFLEYGWRLLSLIAWEP